jgi:orotate phosphoribosyltransferase
VIALDRQEKAVHEGADAPWSAVQYVRTQLNLQVAAIATLEDLLQYLDTAADPALHAAKASVQAYRARYGV